MSISTVYFDLYNSDGLTFNYRFLCVYDANYPHTEKQIIEHTNVRGKGSITIDGGESPWDLTLRGVITGTDYEDLTTKIDAMETAIVLNTPYVLKINKTVSTYYSYNVKRITPIEWESSNLRNNYIEYVCTLRVSSW